MNNKILSTKFNAIFLVAILIAGTIAAISPSFIIGAQAQEYYGMDKIYKKSLGKDVSVKSIKCNNVNVNVNGLELNLTSVPFLSGLLASEADEGERGAGSYGSGERNYGDGQQSGYDNNNSFKFICINNNNNTVVGGEEPVLPEPQTGSLTVNKEIYGCNNFTTNPPPQTTQMSCPFFISPIEWILCDDPEISNTAQCQNLTEDQFDIEVLDDQGNQIAEFEGSVQGETIDNLEPGTYIVNEIEAPPFVPNQLSEDLDIRELCTGNGFDGGGAFINTITSSRYDICIEYEDEQGNDCSTVTLAAGQERTCTVKNYILFGQTPT